MMARRQWQTVLAATLIALAGTLLWRQLAGLSLQQLRLAFLATPWTSIGAAFAATAISFSCLAGYESFAVQWALPGRVSRTQAWRTGAMAHAISNTLGFHALSGGAFRYQQYARLGLGVADVARIVALVAVCVGVGVVLVSAGAFAWLQWQSSGASLSAAAAAAVVLLAIAVCWKWLRRQDQSARAAGHFARLAPVAALEMLAAVTALYVLLPAAIAPAPAQFVLVVVGATLFGIASHAPGGIGVFEAGVLAGLPHAPVADVLAALLLFRVIYNLLPFTLALSVLAWRPLSSTADSAASPAAGGDSGELV